MSGSFSREFFLLHERTLTEILDAQFDDMAKRMWDQYTRPTPLSVFVPKTLYIDLDDGPYSWEYAAAIDTLVAIIRVCLKLWYDDLNRDDAWQRFKLLEID